MALMVFWGRPSLVLHVVRTNARGSAVPSNAPAAASGAAGFDASASERKRISGPSALSIPSSATWMVLPLDVPFQLLFVEIYVAQVARAVAHGLIVEVR